MPYKFLEDIAIADVAFVATGKTLKELFESAALAVTNVMVKDLSAVEQKIKKQISVEAEDTEMLLFNFLQEIIFYKDSEQLLFSKYIIDIGPEKKSLSLSATAAGEKLDMKKHELVADVKAVTLHMFEVKETKDGWEARVILDI